MTMAWSILWNSRPLYVLVVLTVIFASHLELKSQDALQEMSTKAHMALRLTAIATMEQSEYNMLKSEAARDEVNAEQFQAEAKYLDSRSRFDTIYATRNRNRGYYFEKIAVQERKEAEAAFQKVEQVDALRVELLANLTADQEQEEALEQLARDRKVNLGFCDKTKLFETMCAIIGGASGLQLLERQEIDEQLKIVQESQSLSQLEKREFLDELVVAILLGKSDQYKKTATDLLHIADLLDVRAKQDAAAAIADSETANKLFAEERSVELRIEKGNGWKNKNQSTAEALLMEAEHDSEAAYWYALEAVLLALVALVYFLPTGLHKSVSLTHDLIQAGHRDEEDTFWRQVSYCVQHALIFLLVTGMVDTDYLLHLDTYDVSKRAVIVVWFAYLVAGLQTILLHTLPHCMAEYPFDNNNLRDISEQFFLRLFSSIIFSIMELLILWLTVRDTLFTPDSVQFLASWSIRLVGVLMLATHIAVFEPRDVLSDVRADEQSTVLTSDDEDDLSLAATESSPLRGDASSSSPTEDLPLVYFGAMRNSERPRSVGSTTRTASPYTMNTDEEYIKLSITFEALLIVCALCVLRNGVTMTWTHSVATSLAVLGLGALLLTLALSVFFFQHEVPTSEWVASAKQLTYTSIDV